MFDSLLPSKDENLLQPFDSENPKDLLTTSHPCQNPLNPGFGEQLKAFDNPVGDLAGEPLWESVFDPEETHLDPSLVDLLTGEALQNFAADPDFTDKISLVFGDNWNREVVQELQQDWLSGDFSDIPDVRILSADVLSAANGAYSSETDTIYLSRDFLMENAANPAAVADVLLEEYGHAIDAKINTVDSDGDEGEILASVVQGEVLSDGELLALKVEDDSGVITLDGEEIAIEQAKFKPKAGGDRVVDIIRQERGSWMDNHRDAEMYLSKGDWNFNKQSILPNMGDFNGDLVNMVTGDFNGDGLTDFIRQEKGHWIDGYRDAEVYLAAGNGTFRNPIPMTDTSDMNGNLVNLVAGDFNGDGKTDIIRQEKGRWMDGYRDAEIYFSNGNGTFGNRILMNNASAMNGDFVNLIVGDFTGGGADDIIRQEKGNWVNGVNDVEFWTYSRGNFSKVANVPDMGMMNGNFVNLIAGDFNGDRIIDLVRQEKGSWVDGRRDAEIYISNGRWNFRSVTLMNNAWWMNGDNVNLIAGDFTGGGADDLIRQEKGRWVDGSNDVEFLTYSGGNFNKVKNVPDMGAMNGNLVTLVPGLFGSSSETVTNPTPNPNPTPTPNPGGKPGINIELVYPNGDFNITQRSIFEQAANNWEGIITRDNVPGGVLKLAVTQGSKDLQGNNWGGYGAMTWGSDDWSPNSRPDFTSSLDGENNIHFNSAFLSRYSKNSLVRLTMHEIGHALGLNEAQNDASLYDSVGDSLMDWREPSRGGQDMKITEGMYRKLEWFGYGVSRQFQPNWW